MCTSRDCCGAVRIVVCVFICGDLHLHTRTQRIVPGLPQGRVIWRMSVGASKDGAAKKEPGSSWLDKYKMKKGGEGVGPSLDDVYWCSVSLSIALANWFILCPLEHAHTFSLWWVVPVFLRNFVFMSCVFEGFHQFMYVQPFQESARGRLRGSVDESKTTRPQLTKFNPAYPTQQQHERDRRSTMRSLLVNSVMECTMLYAMRTGAVSHVTNFSSVAGSEGQVMQQVSSFLPAAVAEGLAAVDLDLLMKTVAWLVFWPFFREIHFVIQHYTLHLQPLYKWFHAHHHLSYNPGPWSGLAMHPVESVTYFTNAILPFFLCSQLHPIVYLFANTHAQIASVYGHHGHAEYGGSYFHYLHHAKVFDLASAFVCCADATFDCSARLTFDDMSTQPCMIASVKECGALNSGNYNSSRGAMQLWDTVAAD